MFVKYSGFIEKLQHPGFYITHLQESVFNDKYIYMLIAKFAVGNTGCPDISVGSGRKRK